MKTISQFGGVLLALFLCLFLLPTSALAAGPDIEKAIQLADSGTAANISGGQVDSIYFGTYQQSSNGSGGYNTDPIKWRVLSNSDGKLFLLSDQNLDVKPYNSSYTSITWEKSTIRSWLNGYEASKNNSETDYSSDNFIDTAFSSGEQGAIAQTYVHNKTQSNGTSNPNPTYSTSGGENTTDKIFLLSIEEATDSGYFPNGNSSRISTNTAYVASYSGKYGVDAADYWWLRSPGHDGYRAASVNGDGGVSSIGDYVYIDFNAVRPAFNLDLKSVLFTSAAVGGKIPAASSGGNQGGAAADAIFEIGDYSGNEWKLTLLDSSRNFSVTEETASGKPGDTITLNYTGATTGAANEYISVIIADSSDSVLYYGRVAQPGEATGTATITVPSGLTAGNYTLKVFSEQCNGDKMTDYASAFQDVVLHVHSWSAAWSSDDDHHWHDCTAAGCPITDNSGKDGYGTHTFGGWTTNNNGTHTQACTCGEQKTSNCTYDGEGKCTVCGYARPIYTISADTASLDFGSAAEGYTTAPAAQTVTVTNTGNQNVTVTLPTSTNYIITAGTGFTSNTANLTPSGTATFTVQPNTGLAVGDYSGMLTISGSNSTSASVELSFEVLDTYTLTVNLNGGSGSTAGGEYTEGTAIPIDAGSRSNYRFNGWTTSNGGSFADASSAQTTFTMPAADTTITANWQYNGGGGGSSRPDPKPEGPSTGGSKGWENIQQELENAKDGETVTIDMNGETEVPGEVWETIAGRDVTVILDMGEDVSWTVDGNDVPAGASFGDMDFGVNLNTTGINVDVINAITGEVSSVQITLAHDGEFGFILTLTAPLGAENAGYWANLYHYDEDDETLNYETSGEIKEDGTARLRMTHASQYAIIIDKQTHQLPFTDVASGAWYEQAVRYAYLNGIMAGTSGTAFQPNGTLSRAMAVQILYNLEGQPDISEENLGYPYSDVDAQAWYGNAVYWARITGVATGYGDGTFQPTDSITRQEFAQVLYNYAKYKGYDLSAQGDFSTFPDSGNIAGWAETAMSWANGEGLINGHENGLIDPTGTATRAQAASILTRFDQNVVEN